MARIDAYVRSIEKFGAHGLVLVSNQNILLKFPDGDKPAAQSVPHDQLVAMVREVAPPEALAAVDSGRPAQFALPGDNGKNFTVRVESKLRIWTVTVEQMGAGGAAASAGAGGGGARRNEGGADFELEQLGSMVVERTHLTDDFDDGIALSSSNLLEEIGVAGRAAGARDIIVAAGFPPLVRVGGGLSPLPGFEATDPDSLERDLSASAPADTRVSARDGVSSSYVAKIGRAGKFRVTMFHDLKGLGGVLRVLPDAPYDIGALGVPAPATQWAALPSGLLIVAGGMGTGKTTTKFSLLQHINQTRRAHIVILDRMHEYSIDSHASLVSQRIVDSTLAKRLRDLDDEGPDVISTPQIEDAGTLIECIRLAEVGALVIVEAEGPTIQAILDQWCSWVPEADRPVLRRRLSRIFVGGLAQTLVRRSDNAGVAVFECITPSAALRAAMLKEDFGGWDQAVDGQRGQGAIRLETAISEGIAKGAIAADSVRVAR